jgi:hypothetical protein
MMRMIEQAEYDDKNEKMGVEVELVRNFFSLFFDEIE